MSQCWAIDFPHKILVPQRPRHLVARPHLTSLLGAIVERRLIILAAPAGYGKTSLLIDFANSVTCMPICWYTLDRSDEDPWVFLEYLATAITQHFPMALQRTTELLAGRSRPPFATVVATLIRDAYAIGTDFAIIFDDWHLVDPISDISQVITQLLLHCPLCHIILASRTYPSMPDLMLLVARQQLGGLSAQHLRFTASEAALVLSTGTGAAISSEQLTALVEQTNGWITGILLSCQAPGLAADVPFQSGVRTERQVYQFLTEQVFDQQPSEIRSFLLDTALLDDLTAERCDAIFMRSDSAQLLETLLHHHVFITEIRPGVLRYHPLFREFLHEHYRQLDSQRYRAMALQVANTYMTHGQWSLAFDVCVAARDLQAAQRIAAAGGEYLYAQGRLETLEGWFNALPQETLDVPLLCLQARVLLERGKMFEAQVLANQAAARMHPGEDLVVMLLQAWLAHIAGRYDDACALAAQVLSVVQVPSQRVMALRTLGICHYRLNQTARAATELKEALEIARQQGDLSTMVQLQHDLGICHERTGLLNAAEEYFRQADAYWALLGNTARRSMSRNSLGVVQHLMGRYGDAHATLTMALQDAHDAAMLRYQATVLASLGDLYSDLQCWNQAHAAYADARQIGSSTFVMCHLDLADIRLLLRQGKYDAAARALRQLPEPTVQGHPGVVALLHGSIAYGLGQYEQAYHDAQTAIATLTSATAAMDLARAYLFQAQVIAARSPVDHAALAASLEQAVQIADHLGHDAFLVAETLSMSSLMQYASATKNARVSDWLRRHQDVRLAAQALRTDDQRSVLVVRTFGTDQIVLNGQPINLGWRKAREVFYYLLAHPDGASSGVLREAIWPDLSPQGSSEALRRAIYRLRAALPSDMIASHGRQGYRLNRQVVQIDYDVEQFMHVLDTCYDDHAALIAALRLYHGAYLSWSESCWSRDLRMALEQRYLYALRIAAEHCMRAGAHLEARIFYERILTVDQLDEAAHAGIMNCHVALGNRAAAITQYQTLRRLLNEELGFDPGSEIEQVYRTLLVTS